jgi:subtilisin family serine protease
MAETYSYRNGQRVALEKSENEFVVRALPSRLAQAGLENAIQISSASSRVAVPRELLERMMAQARTLAPTFHAYKVAETGADFDITDRVFVRLAQGKGHSDADALAAKYGLVVVERYSDRDYLFRLSNYTGMNPIKLVVRLTEEEKAIVESADHDLNYVMQRSAVSVPTDPQYVRQWHLHRRLQHPNFDHRASALCEDAWQLLGTTGSTDVVIGVTDDGCKLDHPDFDSQGKIIDWGYFQGIRLVHRADPFADPRRMYTSGENHGTSCAAVAAAEVDGLLTTGAAPACRLLPIKWEMTPDGGLAISDSKMLAVLRHVADKIDILSNSWGAPVSNLWAPQVRDRLRQLALTGGRRSRGILFLWAAGNENRPVHFDANVDVPFRHGWIKLPNGSFAWTKPPTARKFRNELVGIPGVLHVAALASTGRRSHYSNYGPGVALCAPSSNSHAYFRMTVAGLDITTASGEPGDLTHEFGGTSSATPLVAGIAGLVISANPALTALQVAEILKKTASKDLDFTPYPRTPPAVFDPDTSWDVSPISPFDNGAFANNGAAEGSWSPWFGHGKVDASAAVRVALETVAPNVSASTETRVGARAAAGKIHGGLGGTTAKPSKRSRKTRTKSASTPMA